MSVFMNWETPFFFHATAFYQLAAFPFAILFHYLCASGNLSINTRYTFLLVGGFLLAWAAMGCYVLLLLISVFSSLAVIHSTGPQQVHTWAFFVQMTWQTLCHLGLHYKEYYLQEAACIRLPIALSALMLMTQKVTSLALDIHEKKVRVGLLSEERRSCCWHLLQALPLCTYLLCFPILLGGPLCSFRRFQAWVKYSKAPFSSGILWAATWKGLGALGLGLLNNIVRGYISPLDNLTNCTHFGCVYITWTSALSFRLTYYSHWLLDESLFLAAGLGLDLDHHQYSAAADGLVMDTDIWTLETSNTIAGFTRTWNKSTAQWLRRLIFQQSSSHPLLATFAFSAWWHGLRPGQVFGFMCWAIMVEADYRFHQFLGSVAKSRLQRLLYQTVTWCHTQLVVAFIMIAVEVRSVSMLWQVLSSYNSFFPLVSVTVFLLLVKK